MEAIDFNTSCEDILEIHHRLEGPLSCREIYLATELGENIGECADGPDEPLPAMQTEKSYPYYSALEAPLSAGGNDAMTFGQKL